MSLARERAFRLFTRAAVFVVGLAAGCSDEESSSSSNGGSGGTATATGTGTAGSGGTAGSAGTGGSAGTAGSGGSGPPPELCDIPAELVDTSVADAVVGDGTPSSCTEARLDEALAGGGIITFDCGSDPHTITVTAEKVITADTVIDGAGLVTLSGGDSTRILAIHSSFELETPALTVQRLTFRDGRSSGPGDDTDVGGGAIYRRGGRLTIIDSEFYDNHCPGSGQDVAGGAVYCVGGGETIVVGSTFVGNVGSNGGALGNLHNDLTVVNTTITENAATGTGGNPGDGGNGGGIYIDGVGQDVTMCAVVLANNDGNAFGGGLFRVSNDGTGSHDIEFCTVDGNAIPDHDPSKAGGLYLQGMAITITNTTISNNEARSDGGMFAGPNGTTLNMLNATIAHNTALSSLGGGMSIAGGVTGTIKNCTFANNRAPGEFAFAGATVGGAGVVLQNTVVDGHEVGNGWNPISCRDMFQEGGGNLQHPVERAGGGSDDPDALCTPGTLVADSELGPLTDNGGPTRTLMPAGNSPAIGHATDCPPTDQRGEPRGEPCTSGAVEAD